MEITADQWQAIRWLLRLLWQIIHFFQLRRANRAREEQVRTTEEQVRVALAKETPKAFWFGFAFAAVLIVILFATAYSSRRLLVSA